MRSLQARMFVVFALIATIPLAALSYLALAETRAALTDEVGSAHQDAAGAAAGFVDVYIENGRSLLASEARSPALREAVSEPDRAAILLALQGLVDESRYRDERIFRSAIYLDDNGTVEAAYPPAAATVGSEAVVVTRFVIERGGLVALPVPAVGAPVLPLAVPVSAEGDPQGVLLVNLDIATLGTALQAFGPGVAQAVYLTDNFGRLLAHPDLDLVLDGPRWHDAAPVERALGGESGYLVHFDPALGEEALAAYSPIPRLGWVVVSTIPTAEAYASLSRLSAVLIVLSGILGGAIVLATVVVARRIVRPVHELTLAARHLAGGNLGARISPRGDDEIAALGAAFNEMANRIGESLEGLRRSEARYRSLVESTNDLIFTIQPEGDLSFVSPLAKDLLGWRPHELVGHKALDQVHPADRHVFGEAVRSVLARGEAELFVAHRLVTADGESRPFLTTFNPIFDGGDKPARVLGVAHDVTQERRQELIREKAFQMARLVSEERGLAPLASRGLDLMRGVVGVGNGATFIGSGDALREVAATGFDGLSPTQRNGVKVLASLAVLEREPRREALDGDAGEGARVALALPLVERGEALGAVVLVGEDRKLSGENLDVLTALGSQLAVGLRRSLFEARLQEYAAELESRVDARTAELSAKSQEMESFLYSVSHDLKAPLISIQGYAQALQEDYGRLLEGEGAQFLDRIRRNATLMEGLILDILELSRVGRIHEQVEEVAMDAVLRGIEARLADRFAAQGGRLVIADRLPAVSGERKRLDQLFTNLIENALKYRHPARPPQVRVWAEGTRGEWVFHVEDNGRGIPARYHDHLFRVFQRIPIAGMDDPGGTGVGLAIVKRIVDAHGGRIWMDSREGEGTTFHVALSRRSRAHDEAFAGGLEA